jgi:hypothetical protein
MILLDNRLTDLVRGYDRISQADLRRQTEWRQHLLKQYAAQRDRHASAVEQYLERIRALKPQLSIIAYVPVAMLVGGSLLMIVGMVMDVNLGAGFPLSLIGLSLLFAGALGLILPALLWLWRVKLAQPAAPAHPLQRDLLPRLMPQWRDKLREPPPRAQTARARALIERLSAQPLDSMYLLVALQLARGEQVDAVVIGARGIWVFALVDWEGRIMWRAGEWSHERFDRAQRAWVRLPESSPEQQWQRMATSVSQTLAPAAGTLGQFPTLLPPRGGIVFTHPQARYEIATDCPTRWGDVDKWSREIAAAPMIQGLDDRTLFGLLDVLLERHHEMVKDAPTISMSAYATKMIRQTEARLYEWVK